MDERKKIVKYLIVGSLFFLGTWIFNIIAEIRERNYGFRGIIQHINYNEKKTPNVKIDGKEYSLSTNWRFNEKMNVGDSLIKEKGFFNYKLIKYKTGEVILFQ